jgi:quercetin dioxygenase-like cupin family protein
MPEAKARTIPDLSALEYADRHVGAHHAPVHRTDELQVGVYVLDPGGRIPAHRHSTSWDIALVLEGEIEARIGEGEGVRVVRCGVHAMNMVPPGVLHELRNAAGDAPARFLLVQSPVAGFDFLREKEQ